MNFILKLFLAGSMITLLSMMVVCRNDHSSKNLKNEPELVFRFALQPNKANKAWEAANLMRQYLERESNGRIKVMFYDSGVLGAERQLLEACYLGVVEMVQATSSVLTTLEPTYSLLDMPYIFVNEDHHKAVLDGEIGRDLLNNLRKHRLQGLAFYSCGFRNLFTKYGPVIKPEDMNGLKIRVMESPIMIKAINYMGAKATPLSAGELFQALKTGVVDGAENNPNVFVSDKYYEAGCKYYSFTEHFANQHVMVASLDWLEKVKLKHPDLYAIIMKTPNAIKEEYNRRWDAAVEASIDAMKQEGVTIANNIDKKSFINSIQPLLSEFLEKHPEIDRNLVKRINQKAGL